MRKFIIALAASAVLFMSPASAEFTDAEKLEVAKIVRARQSVSPISVWIGQSLASTTGIRATRSQYADLIRDVRQTSNNLGYAFGWVSGEAKDEPGGSISRPRDVELANFNQSLDFSILGYGRIRDTAQGLSNVVLMDKIATEAQKAIDTLNSFDRTLAYAEPFPEGYPRIVGPHGDWVAAQGTLGRTDFYWNKAWAALEFTYRTTQVWPEDANKRLGTVLTNFGEGSARLIRGWAMGNQVYLSQDLTRVLGDTAAGSGLRPAPFFGVILSMEVIMNSKVSRNNFRGRPLEEGFAKNVWIALSAYTNLLKSITRENDIAEMRRLFDPDSSIGWAAAFYIHFADFWKDLDAWNVLFTEFFFEIPAPPGSAPAVVCGAGTFLDDISMPSQCLPDEIPPVTVECGVGTVRDDSTDPAQCVAIPVPPVETENLCTELVVGSAMLECRKQVRVLVE